jgi:tetratricopeptide (TPR) repeat protein
MNSLYRHALFSTGKFSEAVEAYEKGLEIDPSVNLCSWSISFFERLELNRPHF